MRSNKSVISAMLGIAFLAMPITAAARPERDVRRSNPAPAFHPASGRAFHLAPPAPRFNPPPRNFPRIMPPANVRAENQWNRRLPPVPSNWKPAPQPVYHRPLPPVPARPFVQPMPPVPSQPFTRPLPPAPVGWNQVPPPANPGWIPPGHRRDYRWTDRHQEPDRDDFRTVCDNDGDNCRQVPYQSGYTRRPYRDSYLPPQASYAPSYPAYYNEMPYTCDEDGDDCRPNASYGGGYSDIYGANPQYNYTPMAGEDLLAYRARLQAARDRAVVNYRMALRRNDRPRANALRAFIRDQNNRLGTVNRRIAAQGGAGGYAYSPAASLGSYAGAYSTPYASSTPYGYGSGSSGLYSAVAPLLGNFVP